VRVAEIAPIGEFGDVLPEMLFGNVDVSAAHRALEVTKVALNRVGMVDTAHVFFCSVLDRSVLHA
jgi:hypothetical protein